MPGGGDERGGAPGGPRRLVDHFFAAQVVFVDDVVSESASSSSVKSLRSSSTSVVSSGPSRKFEVVRRLVYPDLPPSVGGGSANPSDLILLFCLPSSSAYSSRPWLHDFVLTDEGGNRQCAPISPLPQRALTPCRDGPAGMARAS